MKKTTAKEYLEYAVHLLEFGLFESGVFCHDKFWLDKSKYAEVNISFFKLLQFLDSCGIRIQTKKAVDTNEVRECYRHILPCSIEAEILSYELIEADFTEMNIEKAIIPKNCLPEDFCLLKLYLILRTGAALNKESMEKICQRKLTYTQIHTLRKQIEMITCNKLYRRKDNSFEMRKNNEKRMFDVR